MKESTRKWLKERADFGTGTRAKEIMEYIEDLEKEMEKVNPEFFFSDKMKQCLAIADADRPTLFNYGSGE